LIEDSFILGFKMRYHHIQSLQAEKYHLKDGESTTFLATALQTDGKVSIFDSRLQKGSGAPWHYHDHDDEFFYLISGEVEFGIHQDLVIAQPGDLVIAGPSVPRRFQALTDSHLLVINAPSGPSEGFLREIIHLTNAPTHEERAHFVRQFGIHIM